MSPDAVDEMTVERVDELMGYWSDYPPPHVLVRAAVGFEPKPERKAPRGGKRGSVTDLEELARAFGGQVVSRGR